MAMISPDEWAQFETELSGFNAEVGQQPVVWNHISVKLARFGEDPAPTTVQRELKCLVSYNGFKVWPMGRETDPGLVDKEHCYLLLNNTYLSDAGWLTAQKNFNFNPSGDTFIVNGITYEYAGDTPVSQGHINPIYSILILKRKTSGTGDVSRP